MNLDQANLIRKKVANDLNIPYDTNDQDWGLVYGDATRIKEFIDYFDNKRNYEEEFIKYDLYDLILSSFNESLLEEKFNDEVFNLLTSFLKKYRDDLILKEKIEYWKSGYENDSDFFLLGKYL